MQGQMNGFEDAFNTNTKNSPQIALNHNGTVFKDASNYVWKVGFTYKNMIIYCDKCLKLAARTSHCQAVKDRILRLQKIGLIGDAAPLMCTCIGAFRRSAAARARWRPGTKWRIRWKSSAASSAPAPRPPPPTQPPDN